MAAGPAPRQIRSRRSTMPQQGRPTPQRSVPRRPAPSSTYSASRFTRRTATGTTGAAPRYKPTRGCTLSSAAPPTGRFMHMHREIRRCTPRTG
ncbi:hypothetical protein PVAP13_8KG108302 [Panicum virgatum]|uniref:Uncharacterized protein n=1 Tax=Panicum virgatum TaxID=38727 RepID=A0A8T0PKA0_PANVG|nr:hypothetical protein PVAP13_8KG108302 [Panicum virgatum]